MSAPTGTTVTPGWVVADPIGRSVVHARSRRIPSASGGSASASALRTVQCLIRPWDRRTRNVET